MSSPIKTKKKKKEKKKRETLAAELGSPIPRFARHSSTHARGTHMSAYYAIVHVTIT